MIDTSGSLQQTDPGDGRVSAAQAALASLASLTDENTAGQAANVDVAINGFSVGIEPTTPWTALSEGNLSSLLSTVTAFANRNTGVDTDYLLALQAIEGQLATESAALTANGGPPPCTALLWFTDGQYSIQPRDTPFLRSSFGTSKPYAPGVNIDTAAGANQAVQQGEAALCAPGGVADQLHDNGVVTIAVQLTTEVNQQDEDYLQSVVTGNAGGQTCGTKGTPETGDFLPAGSFSELPFLFNQVTDQIGGGSTAVPSGSLPVCPGLSTCASGSTSFAVDSFDTRFRLLASTAAPSESVRLTSPSGGSVLIPMTGGQEKIGSANLVAMGLGSTLVSANVALPEMTTDWVGEWTAALVGPPGNPGGSGQIEVTLYGGARVVVVDPTHLVAGTSHQVKLQFVRSDGRPAVPPSGRTNLTVTVTDPVSGKAETAQLSNPTPTGSYSFQYRPAPDGESEVSLATTLLVESADGQTPITSSEVFAIPVVLPPTFPQISPNVLELSSVTGHGTAKGLLSVRAPLGGCISEESPSFGLEPRDALPLQLQVSPVPGTPRSCLKLSAGTVHRLSLEVSTFHQTSGEVHGSLRFTLTSNTGVRAQRIIPFEFSTTLAVNQAKRLTIFLVLLLLGLLLPLLLLMAVNYLQAHIAEANRLTATSMALHLFSDGRVLASAPAPSIADRTLVSSGGGPSSTDQTPFRLTPQMFLSLGLESRRHRRISIEGLNVKARVSTNPFAAPFAEVAQTGSLTAAPHASRSRDGLRTKLPLGLAGSWVLAVELQAAADAQNAGWALEGADPDLQLPVTIVVVRHESASSDVSFLTANIRNDVVGLARSVVQTYVPAKTQLSQGGGDDGNDAPPAGRPEISDIPDY